jgi:hypothetical protein
VGRVALQGATKKMQTCARPLGCARRTVAEPVVLSHFQLMRTAQPKRERFWAQTPPWARYRLPPTPPANRHAHAAGSVVHGFVAPGSPLVDRYPTLRWASSRHTSTYSAIAAPKCRARHHPPLCKGAACEHTQHPLDLTAIRTILVWQLFLFGQFTSSSFKSKGVTDELERTIHAVEETPHGAPGDWDGTVRTSSPSTLFVTWSLPCPEGASAPLSPTGPPRCPTVPAARVALRYAARRGSPARCGAGRRQGQGFIRAEGAKVRSQTQTASRVLFARNCAGDIFCRTQWWWLVARMVFAPGKGETAGNEGRSFSRLDCDPPF